MGEPSIEIFEMEETAGFNIKDFLEVGGRSCRGERGGSCREGGEESKGYRTPAP